MSRSKILLSLLEGKSISVAQAKKMYWIYFGDYSVDLKNKDELVPATMARASDLTLDALHIQDGLLDGQV